MVGSFGPLVFDASHVLVQEVARTGGKNTAQFQLISGKPRSQYIGATLKQISLSVFFCASVGARPRDMLETLQRLTESSAAYYLVIGGRVMAQNPMTIKSVSEDWGEVYMGGELFSATVSLTLEEYL